MTRNVIGIESDATIAQAIEVMLRSHISGLPVFDANKTLVGILSEGDLLRRAELGTEERRPRWIEFLRGPGKLADDYVQTHGRKVEEVMTCDVVTTTETANLSEAVDLMKPPQRQASPRDVQRARRRHHHASRPASTLGQSASGR